MEILNEILIKTIESFDFGLVFVINVLTYLVVITVEGIAGHKITTWKKRIVLVICAVILGVYYSLFDYNEPKLILNSCLLAPVAWSWLGKPICKFLNIDYKE